MFSISKLYPNTDADVGAVLAEKDSLPSPIIGREEKKMRNGREISFLTFIIVIVAVIVAFRFIK